MNSVWSKRSGVKLAVFQEGQYYSFALPIENGIPIELISGELPSGMFLVGNQIQGVPNEVARNTVYRFVLRATSGTKIYDRTYNIEVQGADEPEWVTPSDLLPVGKNNTFFILDSSPVDYQLEAVDSDTAAGQELQYFIPSDGGVLPPGISLTEDGRLVGVVDPILALEKDAGNGYFDTSRFDKYPYDFAVKNTLGFDSFFYDVNRYDFASPAQVPRKLNRYYEFTVSVSDGDSVSNRTFRIFVVGDDFLRADNLIMQVGTGIFTADNTYLRTPIWLTPSNLGVRRANNFITLFLDTLDPNDIAGNIIYDLLPDNDDGTSSELPPGTEFDRNTGEVFGRVPYQPAVTKEYKFTVNARRLESQADTVELQQFAFEFASQNSTQIKINKMNELSSRAIGRAFSVGRYAYRVVSIQTSNTEFDIITIDKPLFADIAQGTEINLGIISVASQEIAESAKTFTVSLIGEVDSTIKWISPNDLGTIPSNYVSILKLQAETNVPNSFLLYTIESGSLPPGLSLSFSGEIIGTVDNAEISQSENFSFTVKARDQFGFSAIEKTFVLRVENLDDTIYTSVYYKPLLPQEERTQFINFVNNSEIFPPESIYRPQDPNFGTQTDIKILVYAGIEVKNVENYVAAAAKHTSRKTLKILDVKKAIAQEPGTNNEIYEVVYLDVYDPYEKSSKVSDTVKVRNTEKITVDSMSTTPKNPLYDTTRLSSVIIAQRTNNNNKIFFENTIPIETRTGAVNWIVESHEYMPTRNNNEQQFVYSIGSSTNIFYRPDPENTLKTDSDIVKISNPNTDLRYIGNISNVRDSFRSIGNTERNFLPLWMRTAQPGTLQELGYTLAVPLAYCKPGEADKILSAIRVSEFDFRQFSLEVDRFVIDASEEQNQEQYILFANYEYTLA